jgi:endonuclease III
MAVRITLGSAQDRALEIIKILRCATVGFPAPAAQQIIDEFGVDPFLILISCLLSLRARDSMSVPVSRALFERARTPRHVVALSRTELEKIIHPIGFYKNKARVLQEVAQALLDRFRGNVPSTEAELLSIKGIGRKTANLVLGEAFHIPAICVDVHVHRIANRLGLVKTNTPEETEEWLKYVVPREQWIEINRLFVMWGQNICLPTVPRCSRCALEHLCPKFHVKKSK